MSRARQRRIKHVVLHKPSKNNGGLEKRIAELEGKIAGHASILSILIESSDKLDVNLMGMVNVLKEVFGQLSQIDEMLKLLDTNTDGKTLDERIDSTAIKIVSEDWFKQTVSSALKQVIEERVSQLAKRRNAEMEAKEALIAEQALKDAEDPAMAQRYFKSESEHPAIPEGAEVFGE